ncbi:MAG: 3-deoxy-7-phosphoheptulonate synthase [Spirochaetia bacterium]|nr:3-deoxy-7-phosphoheptulonate synthase [Spirochaetia bacterium]MBQ3647223.1 3-deoxy-7-phosphoheptulonate synthase [Spirochaetia bacterium]MBQ3713859.1 3-deoxy-7-phosphoheptulonate synthase [Spirochaetia bacterium]MBQ6673027.1 3-deoxy-7-phosphoheptulonate synthase [Spirochaetia bacterium]
MVIILRDNPAQKQIDTLVSWLKEKNLDVHIVKGAGQTIIGLIGDTSKVDMDSIKTMDIVEDVKRIQEPYKNVNRKFHPDDTVVDIAPGIKIGGGHFQVMAGPCSVEEENQVISIARSVKAAGAGILRGGAFKPRTSPYAFQGLGAKGLDILKAAKKETGMPVVSEIMDISKLSLFEDVDIIQVGARNMQNYELLKELGRTHKPILLKRGLSSTIQELLMSAEYIMAGGNSQIILCERGIRTFETATRNTLDISAVPLLKELTHLPVIVDPSHGTGNARLVKPMAMAAVAAGADGLMIEVHNDPVHALCDGAQSLTLEAFGSLMESIAKILPFAYKR